ncbi:MAG: hypothetical protein ABI599_11335 [Flavobacteriales bacterium]
MSAAEKPRSILSSGFIKMKVKAITNRAEKKKACEAYLAQMAGQRLEQKRSRSKVDDTDDTIRFLEMEIARLSD